MAFNYIQDCFYEKRLNTALHGYNDVHNHWISDFDCFDRCLRLDSPKCRSFEHWHKNPQGLCVRANISLTDHLTVIGHNSFVDYYEIDCRKDIKAIKTSQIHCPDDELFLTVKLNGFDSDSVLLGDSNCKPNWSNETHVQFITHINNCSLILTNGSIIGKLRWESVSKKTYGRFFTCQTRFIQRTSTNRNTLSMLPSHHQISLDDEQNNSPYGITLEWSLHNHSYYCPESCFISLYSFINLTLDDLSSISSKFLIDSCDLKALYPYTNYVPSRRLISHGCSVDPTLIHISKDRLTLSTFHFSFYLYHILKEPIPFQIQCKILHNDDKIKQQQNTDCSSSIIHNTLHDRLLMNKRDYSYTVFRSSSVYVTRQLPSIDYEKEIFHNQNSFISTATVHYTECSLFAFFLLILYAI